MGPPASHVPRPFSMPAPDLTVTANGSDPQEAGAPMGDVARDVERLLATGALDVAAHLAARPDLRSVVLPHLLARSERLGPVRTPSGNVVQWFLSFPWHRLPGLTGGEIAQVWDTVARQDYPGASREALAQRLGFLPGVPPALVRTWLQSAQAVLQWVALQQPHLDAEALLMATRQDLVPGIQVALYARAELAVPTEPWAAHLRTMVGRGQELVDVQVALPGDGGSRRISGETAGSILCARADTPWPTVVSLLSLPDLWVEDVLADPPRPVRARLGELSRTPGLSTRIRETAALGWAMDPTVTGAELLDALSALGDHPGLDPAEAFASRAQDLKLALDGLSPEARRGRLATLLTVAPRAARLGLVAGLATGTGERPGAAPLQPRRR